MNQQDLDKSDVVPMQCPMHHQHAAAQTAVPGLLRVSEVRLQYAADSAMGQVVEWIDEFLAAQHPELGRKGSVCPFVPTALTLDTIWMAEITDSHPDMERVKEVMGQFREIFLNIEPRQMPNAINKAIIVVFSNLDIANAAMVDDVQLSLKKSYVDMGLMLGEFHANNQSPGLRNAAFFPLRGPIPMLGMRHMVDSDLPFLMRADYSPEERASFLRSYVTCMAGNTSANKFELALNGMVEAEIEKWKIQSAQIASETPTLCANCEGETTQGPEETVEGQYA